MHALGALMRIALAIVGAILSVVTGVSTLWAFVAAPRKMIGNCMYEALECVLSWVFSFIIFHPGATSMMMSPQRSAKKPLRTLAS